MSVIYLSHPVHGNKVANCELEAQYDETNGWTRYELGQIQEEPEQPVVNTLVKRGRKPKADK